MRATTETLAGQTILIPPTDFRNEQLSSELQSLGARVIVLPKVEVSEPESYAALDEAIENLFGYDWLIFSNANAVTFFLRRFRELERDISELDALRVCAIGETAVSKLEEAQVHVDLVSHATSSAAVFTEVETYVGGPESLRGLNFLLPRAAIVRDRLTEALEVAGARVDIVAAYRTTSDQPAMIQIRALLKGGGIDCIAFTSSSEMRNLAGLFDTTDIARLLEGTAVACISDVAAEALKWGLHTEITATELNIPSLANAITEFLARSDAESRDRST